MTLYQCIWRVRFVATFALLFGNALRVHADTILLPVAQGALKYNQNVGTTIESRGTFIGRDLLIPQTVWVAFDEYNLNLFSASSVVIARLSGTIFANNFIDTGTRIIDIGIYAGNGTLDISDFAVGTISVAMVSYAPPGQVSVDFNIDVTNQVRALLSTGSQFIGFRYFPFNDPNAPSQLSDSLPPTLTVTTNEPNSVYLLGLGVFLFSSTRLLSHFVRRGRGQRRV